MLSTNVFFVSVETFSILGDFKILVTGGYRATGVNNFVEIIDLETTKSNCPDFPVLPQVGYGAAGALVENAHPIICGGFDSTIVFFKYTRIIFFCYIWVF